MTESDAPKTKTDPPPSARRASLRPKRPEEPRSVVMWVAIAATVVVAASVLYSALSRPPAPAPAVPSATPSSSAPKK